ncbi:hypothetical protein SLS55_009958 [Diplodia seriata]|uniref:Uncharacterized protein n=1 Tax=Diplodia seriata TaxID=420778 RepID=A0ABR3C1H1_9PEZI
MSAPDPKPERLTRGQQAIKRFKIVNRFLQSDAAGIKPGEDAFDLIGRTEYRRQNLSRTRTGSPSPAHRFQGPQGFRGASATDTIRHDSICSEFSATSHGSNGSSSTAGTHGSSSGSSLSTSFMQRTADLRVQPFHQQYQANRLHTCDATDPEDFHVSSTHEQYAGPIVSTPEESGRAMTSISESTGASASTGITTPDLEIDPPVPVMQQL